MSFFIKIIMRIFVIDFLQSFKNFIGILLFEEIKNYLKALI